MSEQIIKTEFSDIMQKSYIDYAMSVICQRALPDVRDGLKPVQRRVLYAMQELGLSADKPHRKSARIVGDTMGKYHPHGDSSIYEALVVMEQDFKKGMPLVDGHGNFGSIEGDGAAAMRYTEAKLQKFTQEVYLADMDKNVVDFQSNFDETEKEPVVLPVRIPNLLINGAEGIAVGMTTSIPPHNLSEVVDGVKAYMDNPDITTEELMEYVKGPDFPTGGIVVNQKELKNIYETGSGKMKLRGKVHFEKAKKRSERDKLVITEIPYTMIGANISKFIADVVGLIENKTTSDIVDVSNESSKEGIRIVLELRRNADVERLENLLYKKTRLEDTFGVNMLAIANGRPELLSLKDIISYHTRFHYEVLTRKYETLLKKELEQKEIKEGLIKASDMIDLIIEILRGSKSLKDAKSCLIHGETDNITFKTQKSKKEASKLCFTEKQASAILEMRLYRLIGLEIMALQEEYAEILKKIDKYQDILEHPASMKKVMKKDLEKIKKIYGFERKTELTNAKAAVVKALPIEEKEVVFVMDRFGYSKILDKSTYERNEETVLKEYRHIVHCMNTDKVCVFTDTGVMHQIKVQDIPSGRLRDKGTPLDNIGNYDSRNEQILLIAPDRVLKESSLLFVTAASMVKLVDGAEFIVQKKTVAATKLAEGDTLTAVRIVNAKESITNAQIIMQSEEGYFLRFPLEEVTRKKKGAIGIRGMKLQEQDHVKHIYLTGVEEEDTPSIIYKEKELVFSKIRLMGRDGKGVKVRR
ncbi:MAG: DNA topoisomerase (ATP-hydrolyzing) [Anaerobutyricum soehngenii]|uniref:DNA topoisomerase (ATP-hydrolyzing) n=1 Tax=Anaerobutyricum soehngenii TaxID=105843 RepID=A0A6N7YEA7_9FIRM|nr:DNA topoisomerase (ATP-hydrolyzing) [Anaerobutyricum soehngenii]MDY5244622.1 DNA topoisomerase (ATP-hydrolyzing) [Anaerobutyricum soehngenii]MSU82713.1 DNA topoisomerase 4 subunit A [Anaerobutyricum soehngenii]